MPSWRHATAAPKSLPETMGIEVRMHVFLTTPRMVLRRFTHADTDALVELDSDPEVMRYITDGVPTSREQVVSEIMPRYMAMYDAPEAANGIGYFVACERETAGFLGWFTLKPGYYWKHELELGYRLRRDQWGRGLATEGTLALIAHVFDALGESKVIATTMRENTASRRVMEKSGMSFECEFLEERWPGFDKRAVKYAIRRATPAGHETLSASRRDHTQNS